MAFNFNFSGNPMLQALAAYQGSYSQAKAAADRQTAFQQAQYGAQEGNTLGAGLASGINLGTQLGFVNPIQQQQQLQFAKQYSQQVTIPQLQAHMQAQEQQHRDAYANQFGLQSWDDFAQAGRKGYLDAHAAGVMNGDPGPMQAYSQASGIPMSDLSNTAVLDDKSAMSQAGFRVIHSQAMEQQAQKAGEIEAQRKMADFDVQQAANNVRGYGKTMQITDPVMRNDFANLGNIEKGEGFQNSSPQDQATARQMATQNQVNWARQHPNAFSPIYQPARTWQEYQQEPRGGWAPNVSAQLPDGSWITTNGKGEPKHNTGVPPTMNLDQLEKAGFYRRNADGSVDSVSRKTGDAKHVKGEVQLILPGSPEWEGGASSFEDTMGKTLPDGTYQPGKRMVPGKPIQFGSGWVIPTAKGGYDKIGDTHEEVESYLKSRHQALQELAHTDAMTGEKKQPSIEELEERTRKIMESHRAWSASHGHSHAKPAPQSGGGDGPPANPTVGKIYPSPRGPMKYKGNDEWEPAP